jgi:hypothetical protein
MFQHNLNVFLRKNERRGKKSNWRFAVMASRESEINIKEERKSFTTVIQKNNKKKTFKRSLKPEV